MSDRLTFRLLGRDQQQSDYDWINIDCGSTRVGKVRGLIESKRVTIHSINIFPAYERQGYAREVIEMFKAEFNTVIADRVRFSAIGFWGKMGFHDTHDGRYVWKRG